MNKLPADCWESECPNDVCPPACTCSKLSAHACGCVGIDDETGTTEFLKSEDGKNLLRKTVHSDGTEIEKPLVEEFRIYNTLGGKGRAGRRGGGRGGRRGGRGRHWRRQHHLPVWPWPYFQPLVVPACGCETSTVPNPYLVSSAIRGGIGAYQCEPGSDEETCYCRDTCYGNPDPTSTSEWWNCSSPKIGGLGAPRWSSCGI